MVTCSPRRVGSLRFLPAIILIAVALAAICSGFDPPWLDRTVNVIVTLTFTSLIYLVGSRLIFAANRKPSRILSIWLFLTSIVLVSLYLWIFLAYTCPLPDHWHRDVLGWELTPGAQGALQPGETVCDLIEGNERKVEHIFTDSSLLAMRVAFLAVWLLLFTTLTLEVVVVDRIAVHQDALLSTALSDEDNEALKAALAPDTPIDGDEATSTAAEDDREQLYRITATPVPSSSPAPRFNIVFVHGVDGHWRWTWTAKGNKESWLEWTASDFPDAAIWSVHYHAATLHWNGTTMRLGNRSRNLLSLLDADDIFSLPTCFVVHSFGGLVVKQLWRDVHDDRRSDVKRSIKGIVFLATPHLGSTIANFTQLIFLRALSPTVTVTDLTKDSPHLIDLSAWYSNHPIKRNYVYFETRKLAGITLVVDEVSSDPRIKGVMPVAESEDHKSICKPRKPGDPLVKKIRKAIRETMT